MRVIEIVSPFEGGRGGGKGGILFEIQFYRCISLATARRTVARRFFSSATIKRVRVRVRGRTFARAPTTFFAVFFPHPFFFLLSTPLHSTPFASCTFSPPWNGGRKGGGGGREIHDMHCFLQEKQWGCFCANDGRRGEARRGEAPVSLVSGGSLLKAKQTFSQSQPLWRSNNRFALPSSWPEKLERNRRIRLFDRNARRGRDWKGRLEKKTRQKRVFLQEREKEISFMNGFMNGA